MAVLGEGVPEHVFLSSVLAYVGLDPRRDVRWESHPPEESMRLRAEDKVDAFAGFPPVPQELRARRIGNLVPARPRIARGPSTSAAWSARTGTSCRSTPSRPSGHCERSSRPPTCVPQTRSRQPASSWRGYAGALDYAAQALREIPYTRWRDYDPEDTVRFYGLRLHEVGMIKSNPQKIIAQGTDWRFLNQLKKELKT